MCVCEQMTNLSWRNTERRQGLINERLSTAGSLGGGNQTSSTASVLFSMYKSWGEGSTSGVGNPWLPTL